MDNAAKDITELIKSRQDQLAEEIMERFSETFPQASGRYVDPYMREQSMQNLRYQLSYLVEAINAEQPLLYADYIRWLKVTLTRFGVPAPAIAANLKLTSDVLRENLNPDTAPILRTYIDENLEHFDSISVDANTFVPPDAPHAALADKYLHALLDADRQLASRSILQVVEEGVPVRDIYLHVFQPVQREIGRLWQMNQITVAQEHYVSASTQWIMAQLYPHIFSDQEKDYVFVGACVSRELHEIGMRMVTDFFEMEGWDTHYVGANTPADSLISMLQARKAHVLGLSVTITSHINEVRHLIQVVRDSVMSHVKILVGGYPFNLAPNLWKQIGADGFGSDALDAVALANKLVADTSA